MNWLKRSFIAGFFVIVPLVISAAALLWIFRIVDGFVGPLYARLLGREIPGLGLVTTVVLILVVGALVSNVIGRRLVLRAEEYLLRVPVFGTIYSPVKQLLEAFSPDNEGGFKRVVMVQDPCGAYLMGFLTKEFVADLGHGPQDLVAVYVPTNNLYLGDIRVFTRESAVFPDITVEEGVRIILTGGMAMSDRVNLRQNQRRGVS
jgi:uncharacterized membrane protein